jgi:CRP-like cAMP-binding protein
MNLTQIVTPTGNRLLDALSEEEFRNIAPNLEHVTLTLGKILYQPQHLIEYVYFPQRSGISIINILENGSMVEVGLIGGEGMAGSPLILASKTSPHQAIVQIADGAFRMPAEDFINHLERMPHLNRLLLRYTQAMMIQIAQTATCNSLHSLEERLARWLLQTQDRAQSDFLDLTQDFLSAMLGVRRASVSVAAGSLQGAGIIKYRRGKITILDREALEEISCECYRVIEAEYKRLSEA